MPDVLHYAWRDYGNRVGIWRMMAAMDRYGVRGSISLNVAVCDHFPDIAAACRERGWEFFSHGVYNTRYTYNMSEDQERAFIEDVKASIRKWSGQELAGWLAPALTLTERTMDLLAEAGIIYTLDLFHDDQPLPVNVRNGRLISVPYSLEINDFTTLFQGNCTPRDYTDAIKAQFDRLYMEGADNGQVMCLPLHPFLDRSTAPHEAVRGGARLHHVARQGLARDGPRDRRAITSRTTTTRSPPRLPPARRGEAVTLPSTYFDYPFRRPGMDHDRYAYSNLFKRKPVCMARATHASRFGSCRRWSSFRSTWRPRASSRRAVWSGRIPTTGTTRCATTAIAWDLRACSGPWKARGLKASVAMSSRLAERYPHVLQEVNRLGFELVAHGIDMNHIHADRRSRRGRAGVGRTFPLHAAQAFRPAGQGMVLARLLGEPQHARSRRRGGLRLCLRLGQRRYALSARRPKPGRSMPCRMPTRSATCRSSISTNTSRRSSSSR